MSHTAAKFIPPDGTSGQDASLPVLSLCERALSGPSLHDPQLPVDESCGLSKTSTVLLEQVRTLDKKRLRERMGRVDERLMEKIDLAIAVSFGLPHQRMV